MSREIKFEVIENNKRVAVEFIQQSYNGGWWSHYSLLRPEEDAIIKDGCYKNHGLETIIRRQYTGLHDKQGKEIYEGDIVKCIALSNDHLQRGAITISSIEYYGSNFTLAITYIPLCPFCIDHDIEVIGNIYENSELLEAKQ